MGMATSNRMHSNQSYAPQYHSTTVVNQWQPTTTALRPSFTQMPSQRPYREYYNPRSGLGYIGPRLPHLIQPTARVYY
jgi:hypothetical protein